MLELFLILCQVLKGYLVPILTLVHIERNYIENSTNRLGVPTNTICGINQFYHAHFEASCTGDFRSHSLCSYIRSCSNNYPSHCIF